MFLFCFTFSFYPDGALGVMWPLEAPSVFVTQTLHSWKNNESSGVWSVCLLQCTFIDHIFNQALREADSSQWGVGWSQVGGIQEALTLQLSGAQAFLQPLHLILQEADMPHHVLRWVYLHGYISRGGRSRNWLVQLLLEDSGVKTKYLVNRLCQQQWKSPGELGTCCLIQTQTPVLVI